MFQGVFCAFSAPGLESALLQEGLVTFREYTVARPLSGRESQPDSTRLVVVSEPLIELRKSISLCFSLVQIKTHHEFNLIFLSQHQDYSCFFFNLTSLCPTYIFSFSYTKNPGSQ